MRSPFQRIKESWQLLPLVIVAALIMIALQEAGCYDPGEYRILDIFK